MGLYKDYFKTVNNQLKGDDKYLAQMDFSIGTVFRMDRALNNMNDYYRLRNYPQCYLELEDLFKEISPFLIKIESGVVKPSEEFKVGLKLLSNVKDAVEKAHGTNELGRATFTPIPSLINSINECEIYIRGLMLKHKLYMKQLDKTMLPAAMGE